MLILWPDIVYSTRSRRNTREKISKKMIAPRLTNLRGKHSEFGIPKEHFEKHIGLSRQGYFQKMVTQERQDKMMVLIEGPYKWISSWKIQQSRFAVYVLQSGNKAGL